MNNFVIYPPASYGSKGDEGMLRGALRLFSPAKFSIINPDRGSWLPTLLWQDQNIDEIPNDEDTIVELVKHDYDLIVVGADVIDGSCGIYPSLARLRIIKQFASAGRHVFVFHSYRSGVQNEIKEFLIDLTLVAQNNVIFFIRDLDSLTRFRSDYLSANAFFFPDLALFCDELSIADEWFERHVDFLNEKSMTVALNVSEHTFRASCADHTDKKRQDFVRGYVRVILDLFPGSNFLIFINDIRSYDNFWSDFDYALAAEAAFKQIGRPGLVKVVEPTLNYGENISILRRCDLVVTGRMHLALAAFRAGCVPVIITGKSYYSETFVNNIGMLDKASGMFNWLFGGTGFVVTSPAQLYEIFKDDAIDIRKIKGKIELRLAEIAIEAGSLVKLYGFNSEACLAPKSGPHNAKLKGGIDAALKDNFYFCLEIRRNLRRIAAECDGQIASLNQAVAERDGQIASLNQAVAERDGQITSLNQSVSDAWTRIKGLENSRSWRMTAPYRWLGKCLKAPFYLVARSGLFSRFTLAILLFPSALVFYGGLGGFLRRLNSGRGTFVEVVAGQAVIRERLLARNRLLRRLVFAGFSLAVRIQRAGSVKRSLGNFFRIIRTEGLGGVRGRMITTAPGMAAALVSVGHARAELPVLAKEVARRILVADYRVPRPDVSAGEHATVGILRDLCALGYEVVFLPNDMVPSPCYEAALCSMGMQVVNRESGFEYSAHYLERHGSEFGTFYFIRVDVAETLLPIARRVAPNAKVIFHAPDLYFLRETREAELNNDPAARERALHTRDRELAMMRQSDRVVLVSPAEVPVLRGVLPDTPISVFPVLYAPVVENQRPYSERKNIFFLGGFGHLPNVNAVQWFAAEVWPHVREALPNVEFHIIGAEAPAAVTALERQPGIKVVGFVPELEPVLETLRVGVAPLQYGAGIKGKVAVTMGAGIPCVCTEIAAEGMGIENDVHALVENDPFRFAQAIVTLYQDETMWSRLAKNGQSLVQDKFGDAANRASLLKVLDQSQALPISLFNDYCQTAEPVAVPNPVAEAEVDVSVIVPVYNKWNLTRACLTSVVQTSVGSGVTYEVILADDGSTDETIRAAEIFPGLRIVKTSKNLGFLRNCNNAAKQARGRYILLLNNDTIVLPGWLESLHCTMEQDPSIAIVGSKLLYPDDHIQEAGGGLLSNADGVSIGRWSWVGERNLPVRRREPIFNIRRESDYISGASILVRKSFWDSVGGFDERYRNAYCEDSDLAMTARSKGLRVVYEPESEVIYFEHQTYADQISADHIRLQEQNKAELIAKWQEVFQRDHLPPGSKWYQVAAHGERAVPGPVRARRNNGKLNILYFSPFPSHPSNHGNQATIQQFARRFQSLGHKVHFALLQSHIYAPEHEQAMRDAWDTFDILPNSHPLASNGQPITFDGWYEDGLGERIRLLCAKYDIDIVFCSYIFQSKMLEYVPNYILKIIDTHDKMGGRYDMLRSRGQPLEFFSCTPEEEGRYLRRADVVVARRAEEAHYFDSVSGCESAIVIPHVEDPHFLTTSFGVARRVGIVASANRINLAILQEFLAELDRQVQGRTCPLQIHVVGQVRDMIGALDAEQAAVFRRPWVQLHGFVEDIGAFYAQMDLIVSPVTMGTGINVKTVQAMAFGMPLLTTLVGIKGVETDEPMHRHADLASLVQTLLAIQDDPQVLSRLAEVSRKRYTGFHDEAMSNIAQLFSHPKLRAGAA